MQQTLEHRDKSRTGPELVEQDFLPLNGTDYVEYYVGNARQAAHFYRTAFGFSLAAYRGPETGTRDRASYVLVQNKIRLVLTTALEPDHPVADHVRRYANQTVDMLLADIPILFHGDGDHLMHLRIANVAFTVHSMHSFK